MQQQRRRSGEVDHDLLGKQHRAGNFGEPLAEKEVAIAGDHADRHAGVGDAAQSDRDAFGERLAQLVVADPGVEQVAEDVDARGVAGRAGAECIERVDQRRPRRRQVEIREEQRGLYRTSSARLITTSSLGTFWWKPLFAVATPLILSTTSWPAVTRPNTQ